MFNCATFYVKKRTKPNNKKINVKFTIYLLFKVDAKPNR